MAYNMFRTAGTLQGIGAIARGDRRARASSEAGRRARPLAERAWRDVEPAARGKRAAAKPAVRPATEEGRRRTSITRLQSCSGRPPQRILRTSSSYPNEQRYHQEVAAGDRCHPSASRRIAQAKRGVPARGTFSSRVGARRGSHQHRARPAVRNHGARAAGRPKNRIALAPTRATWKCWSATDACAEGARLEPLLAGDPRSAFCHDRTRRRLLGRDEY